MKKTLILFLGVCFVLGLQTAEGQSKRKRKKQAEKEALNKKKTNESSQGKIKSYEKVITLSLIHI